MKQKQTNKAFAPAICRGLPLLITLLAALVTGCAVEKYVPEGEYFYTGMKKTEYLDKGTPAQNVLLAKADLEKVLAFKPNGSIVGSTSLRMPFTYPFWINENMKDSKTALGRWIHKNFGAEPIFISTVNPDLRAQVGNQVLREYGYFASTVTPKVMPQGRDSVTAKVRYEVTFGPATLLDSVSYNLPPALIDSLDLFSEEDRLLHSGDPLTVISMQNERLRISTALRDRGYYFFKPELILYRADTMQIPGKAQLRVALSPDMPPEAYEPWRIGNVTVELNPQGRPRELTDSLHFEDFDIRYADGDLPVRPGALRSSIMFKPGTLYNQTTQELTLSALSDLNTFAYSGISYTPRKLPTGENLLDVLISTTLDKPYSTELNTTYKFKSNNQTGPGLGFTLNRKNLFGGGEVLSLEAHGSYEWETRRSANTSGASFDINSYEFTLSGALDFPRLLLPYLYSRNITYPNHTRIALKGGILNRSNFYGQSQFSGELAYRFEPRPNIRHTIQLLSLTYNHMLYQTDRFTEAITQNPALGLSFQNQFIPQITYLYSYEYQDPLSLHFFSIDAYIAEAGGALSLFYKKDPSLEYQNNRFLKALFAQFVKGYGEVRYAYRFLPNLQLATRFYGGAIYSYGNTGIAPFTEQFYAGGANSLRGFNVRSVGPGSYRPAEELPLSFLDRTGDMRLELNAELRYKVIGDLEVAAFVDAGNIWMLRPNEGRPEGEISAKYFLKDVALSSGLGIRYDLSFLVLRLDLGIALHRPDRGAGEYFNTFGHPQLPFAVHIAIGYPF